MVGIGEASSLIHHAQIAWLPAAERRRYALTGPPPPDWFSDMRPAPWITPRVLAEGRKLAGASLVTMPPSSSPALAAVPVPPGQQAPPSAETPSDVPPWDTIMLQVGSPADQVTDGGENLIIGSLPPLNISATARPTASAAPAPAAPSLARPHQRWSPRLGTYRSSCLACPALNCRQPRRRP